MGTFFKIFGKGLLYTIILPFALVAWVLYGVYCLFLFLFMAIKSIILFFRGENISGDTKEDQESRRVLLEAAQQKEKEGEMMNTMFQTAMMQNQMQNAIVNQVLMSQALNNQQQFQNQQFQNQPMFGQNMLNQQPAQQIEQQPTNVINESEDNENDSNPR